MASNIVKVQTVSSSGTSGVDSLQSGVYKYYAGASGTVTVGALERVIGIAAHGTSAASMTVAAGATITIIAGTSVSIRPLGNLVAPVIVFTGTDSYLVETVL